MTCAVVDFAAQTPFLVVEANCYMAAYDVEVTE